MKNVEVNCSRGGAGCTIPEDDARGIKRKRARELELDRDELTLIYPMVWKSYAMLSFMNGDFRDYRRAGTALSLFELR